LPAYSLFSPYTSFRDDPSAWAYEPPMLASSVGWNEPNFPEDVVLVQQIVNILIDLGYLEDQAATRLPETGSWDINLDRALGAIENKYLSGMASPFGQKIIANGSPLFAFIVHLAAGNANLVVRYSPVMYQLAHIMLPGNLAAKHLAIYLPYILQALANNGLADTEMVLMALATIAAETGSAAPVSEGISKYNSSLAARRHEPGTHLFDLYDYRHDLGNNGPPDGANYCGRGFVQLTGRGNYAKYGKYFGWPLDSKPDLANDPWAAAMLLARYLKNHESRIRAALKRNDFKSARSAVNGGTHNLRTFQSAIEDGRAFLARYLVNNAYANTLSLSGMR